MTTKLRISKAEFLTAVAYAVAAAVTIALAIVFEWLAFKATRQWPWRDLPSWLGLALNIVPSVVAGVLVYTVTAFATQQWIQGALASRWFARWMLPLLAASWLLILILMNWSSPDFWLIGQLLIWPFTALVAGMVAEALTTVLFNRWLRRAAA